MAHPFSEHRQHRVEHRRVGHITKGYARGGGVHSDEAEDRKLIKKMMAEEEKKEVAAEGKGKTHRQDRAVKRARGGRTKHKSGKTNVNVIVAPQQHPGMAGPSPQIAQPPIAVPPRPPMPMPPPGVGGPPMAGPAGALPPGIPPRPGMVPPPGMVPRRRGGQTYAKGGAVKSGPAFEEGRRNGTQVTHGPGKDDGKDIGRGKPVTYAKGGRIKRASGGKVEAPEGKKGMGPKPHGGGGGGEGRLEKQSRAEREYAKPVGAHG